MHVSLEKCNSIGIFGLQICCFSEDIASIFQSERNVRVPELVQEFFLCIF